MATADFLTGLLGVLSRAASAPSPAESLGAATEAFRHLVPFDGSGLLLPERKSRRFAYVPGYELWTAEATGEPDLVSADAGIARSSEDYLIASRDELDCEESRALLLAHGHSSVLAIPLRVDDRAIGTLLFFGDDPDAFQGIDPNPLLAGAAIVAVALEHARDRAALERLADELGLRRRRSGDPWIVRESAKYSKRSRRGPSPDLRPLAAIERDAIARVLAHTAGRVSGPRGAAAILGMKPTTLQSRMKKLGVARRP